MTTTTKLTYAAEAALTITLASLPTSSTLLVGEESDLIDNSSNGYIDALLNVQVTLGSSPAAGLIEVWGYGILTDAGAVPAGLAGSLANTSITAAGQKYGGLVLLRSFTTAATSNQIYSASGISLASAFGCMPKKWGIWITHNTTVNLHATAGNHFVKYQGVSLVAA